MAEADAYSAIGLTPDASADEIHAAYQQRMAGLEASDSTAEERQAFRQAYETLSDPMRRLRYDARLAAPSPPRFQMPRLALPRLRSRRRRPVLVGGVALLAVASIAGLLLVVSRGRATVPQPAQVIGNLVDIPTAATVVPTPAPPGTPGPSVQSPLLVTGIVAGVRPNLPPLPTAEASGPAAASAASLTPISLSALPQRPPAAVVNAAPSVPAAIARAPVAPPQSIPALPPQQSPPPSAPEAVTAATAVAAPPTPAVASGPGPNANHIFVPTSPISAAGPVGSPAPRGR